MRPGRIRLGSVTRNVRLLAPFCALLSFALLALVLAAQAGLAFCTNRIAIDMPAAGAMPGMTMVTLPSAAAVPALMICPVVLVLIVASTVLAAAAIVLTCLDPDRACTRSTFARAISRLPIASSVAALCGFGAIAIAAMIAVDGAGLPSPATCALLATVMIAGAFVAVGSSLAFARAAVALGERLLIAIVSAIAARRTREKIFARRSIVRHGAGSATRFVAAPLGLRAPPSFVR
jgi:hypothetical protein